MVQKSLLVLAGGFSHGPGANETTNRSVLVFIDNLLQTVALFFIIAHLPSSNIKNLKNVFFSLYCVLWVP